LKVNIELGWRNKVFGGNILEGVKQTPKLRFGKEDDLKRQNPLKNIINKMSLKT
jgi:ribosome-binding factor A